MKTDTSKHMQRGINGFTMKQHLKWRLITQIWTRKLLIKWTAVEAASTQNERDT